MMRNAGNHRPCRERGATLIELLVALVLMAIGILAVSQLFPTGTRSQQKDEKSTAAHLHAQEKLESLRSLNWSHPDLNPGAHGPDSVGTNNLYAVSYVVSIMPAPMDKVKRVDVTVNYNYLRPRTASVTSYLRR